MQKKGKKITGIISIAVTVLLLMVLIFFTIYGGKVYERITPAVSVTDANMIYRQDYVLIEPEYLTEDECVYLVSAESGFSRTIFRIKKQKVEVCGIAEELGKPMILREEVKGCYIVTNPEAAKDLKDGDKVLIGE